MSETKYLLAAHLGGTKVRIGLQKLLSNSEDKNSDSIVKFDYETRYPIGEFDDALPMINQFKEEAKDTLKEPDIKDIKIEKACLAIAGAVDKTKNKCEMSNRRFSIDGNLLSKKIGMRESGRLQLINDFEAVAYGIKVLKEGLDRETLHEREPEPKGIIAVIGAATGQGQSFCIQEQEDVFVFPSEGGHTDFAPRTELEFELSKYIQDYIYDKNQESLKRVSVERVVSGLGIMAIYSFLQNSDQKEELLKEYESESIENSGQIERMIKTWQKEDARSRESVDPAAVISAAALKKRDLLCMKTMKVFVEAYGAEVGNFALQFLPYGGLYIAGGIAPQILPLLKEGSFMEAFHNKGRMKELLKKIPVYVIKNLNVGLMGAARYAAEKM